MNEQELKEQLQHATQTRLSGLEPDPWLTQRVLANAKGEIKVKKKLSFGLVLALVLTLATVAVAAAMHWGVFDNLIGGDIQNADTVMQSNLHQETVNNVEITIKEAGYDGRTLWLATSYRLLDVEEPFGHLQGDGIPMEWEGVLQSHRVGWWMDAMWINGQEINMPGDSYSTMDGSDVPGELLVYEAWRLDNEGVTPNGSMEIALPIGDTQSVTDYSRKEHPEFYNDDGMMKTPDKGMVTFTFEPNTVDIRTEHPCIQADLPLVTAQVSEVVYSPIMTYVTLGLEVKPNAMDAYVQEHGSSVTMTDEGNQQSFDYSYSGQDVFSAWVESLVLVDGNGEKLFSNMNDLFGYGLTGYHDTEAEFLFPYQESWPDEMYLAPMNGEAVDMSLAVKLK